MAIRTESLQKKYYPRVGEGTLQGSLPALPSTSVSQPIPPQRMFGAAGAPRPSVQQATQQQAGVNLPPGMTGLPGLPKSMPGQYDPTYLADVGDIRAVEAKREGQRDTLLDRLLNVLGPPVVGGQLSGMPSDYWAAQTRVDTGQVRQQFAQRRQELAAKRRRGQIGEGSYRNELNKLARAEASEVGRAQANVRTKAMEQAERSQQASAQAILGAYQATPSDRYRLEMPQDVALGTPNASFSVRGGGGGDAMAAAANEEAQRARAEGFTNWQDPKLTRQVAERMEQSSRTPQGKALWRGVINKRGVRQG